MASEYCDESDLYAYGLPRGSLPNPGRLVESVSVPASTIALSGHGFVEGDPVQLRAEAGGSLPSPLVAGVVYYAAPVSGESFRLRGLSGPLITLTTAGSRVLVIAPLPIRACIRWASALIDENLPAHLVPLEAPYPEIVRATAAELAVGKLMARTGSASKSIADMISEAQKRLARWYKGIPLRGENVPPRANLSTAASFLQADAKGWRKFGGIG